jgi:acetyl esterase
MSTATLTEQPPLGIRVLHALGKERDWSTMTTEELAAFSEAENRKRASRLVRVISGFPERGTTLQWQELVLSDRTLRVRVYRRSPTPRPGAGLPLVVHVHGGGFVGTAAQSDWVNSHLAARLPALVVSVEHRLLAPGVPLSAAVDDGWDVLDALLRHAAEWGVDPEQAAVFGESCGGAVAALVAIRARDSGVALRAQVLVNPCLDVTPKMYDHASMIEHADSPMCTLATLKFFAGLAVPPGTDPRALSPLHTDDLGGLPEALVVVPTIDPLADHGRRYAERLWEAGTPTRMTEYPGATHAFLSTPRVVAQAKPARAEIVDFLRSQFATGKATN